MREFINKKEVRWAISHSFNRDEINQMLYMGLAIPRNYSPIKASPNYYEKATIAHIKYDPKYANDLLDQAGYKEKNAAGQRLWPGTQEPISFILSDHNDPNDEAAMATKYLAAIGITMNRKPVSRVLYDQQNAANDIEAGWWGGDRCFLPLTSPSIFIGTQPDRCWSVAWALWRNNLTHSDPNGEQPPRITSSARSGTSGTTR